MDRCLLFLQQFAQTMDDKFRVSCLKHCYVVVAVAHGAGVATGAVSHLDIEGGVAHYEGGIRREVHPVEEGQYHIWRGLWRDTVVESYVGFKILLDVVPLKDQFETVPIARSYNRHSDALLMELLQRGLYLGKQLYGGNLVSHEKLGVDTHRRSCLFFAKFSQPAKCLVERQTDTFHHGFLRGNRATHRFEGSAQRGNDTRCCVGQSAIEIEEDAALVRTALCEERCGSSSCGRGNRGVLHKYVLVCVCAVDK